MRIGLIHCARFLAIMAGVGSLLTPQDALSQSATGESVAGQLDEITITARRREERLADVPASITALDAQTVVSAGVRSLQDVSKLVPNLSFFENYRAGQPFITMRGVPTAQGGEAPVTVLVDGVQVPGLEFLGQDLLDVANIQVLRGPQGALYGRGAVAGAVLIETQKPTNEWAGNALGYFGNGSTYRTSGTLSGPLSADKLWFRATGSWRDTEGFNPDDSTDRNTDSSRETSARLELFAQPTDALALSLRGAHTSGTDGASGYAIVSRAQLEDFSVHNQSGTPVTDRRRLDSVSFKADWTTAIGTLTSISQYAKSTSDIYGDGDFGPAPAVQQTQAVDVKAFNQDVRLSSSRDEPLQWIVGAFFQHRRSLLDLVVDSQPGGVLPPGLVFLKSDQSDLSRAWAAYAQASYKFGQGYELSTALRYDVDQRESEDLSVAGSEITHEFSAFQPQITLNKRFTPTLLGYVTYGRGFRSGGFNPLADIAVTGVARQYPKETTSNYEIGLKSELLERRLMVNVSVFHMDFDNQQFFFVSVNPPSRDIVSFPKTTIDGGELELRVSASGGLSFTGGLGVSDAKIEDFNGTGLYDDNHSPLSNRFTFNLGAEYRHAIAPTMEGLLRVDYNGAGRIYYEQSNQFTVGPTETLAARIGVEADQWTVSLVGRNLADKRFPALVSPNAFGDDLSGRLPNLPRTYGVEVSARF